MNRQDRFESKYIPEPMSGCWLWEKPLTKNGYGRFAVTRSKNEYAHRMSWRLFRGAIPAEIQVLHRCDVRCCVNPDHLFLGTDLDNKMDAKEKGRMATARNRKNKSTKIFSDEVIAYIRTSTKGPTELGKEVGLSATHVCAIQKGRRRTNVR